MCVSIYKYKTKKNSIKKRIANMSINFNHEFKIIFDSFMVILSINRKKNERQIIIKSLRYYEIMQTIKNTNYYLSKS